MQGYQINWSLFDRKSQQMVHIVCKTMLTGLMRSDGYGLSCSILTEVSPLFRLITIVSRFK